MIDPHKTGAYIARLRKERDWTQVELADKLNVTHQAVSRWETGDSFPDLSTLAQLAQLFRIRMESLLDGDQITVTARDKVLTELAEGHAEQVAALAKADPSDLETVIESGPLTRPSVMNKVVINMSGYQFSLEQVKGLAPFVSQELLESMVAGLGEKVDIEALMAFAPFLGRPQLSHLLDQLGDAAIDVKRLTGLAPFIDREQLDRLVEQTAQDKIESYHVMSLAPFVSQSTLSKLVERLPEKELRIEQLTSLAPFLEHDRLAALLSRIGVEQLKLGDLTALAPFLGAGALKEFLQRVPSGTIDAHTIVALSPFLDRQTLEGIIRGGQ